MQERSSPDDAHRQAPAPVRLRRPISTRLVLLTVFAVMLAEVLIFVPSIANFRHEWLARRVESAAVAGLATLGAAQGADALLEPAKEAAILSTLQADLVAVVTGDASHLIARGETVGQPDLEISLDDENALTKVSSAFDSLVTGGGRVMRVKGTVGDGRVKAEVVMGEAPLRRAMLIYARNILLLSLAIASFAALLVFAAIRRFLIRPIEAMTRNMVAFAENPADPARIIRPRARGDEIGVAEQELAAMQNRLAATLREQRHLADLGLAVSKINHDLRNILASAQMISDRLTDLSDPRIQRFAPVLIRSLDRALSYTQAVLAYGRAVESVPEHRRVRLRHLVEDVRSMTGTQADDDAQGAVPRSAGGRDSLDRTRPTAPAAPGDTAGTVTGREAPAGSASGLSAIEFVNAVPADFEIEVDPGQFHRVLLNLCRNAVQALESLEDADPALVRRVVVSAERESADAVLVTVEDTGPGLPERARENLFRAFRGSARTGGTGLGLAIAAEIVEGHSGTIILAEGGPGARFEIRLPTKAQPAPSPAP
ncbi:HAMP domain-containing sensor histidine kinase [Aurantimonas sp. Leaf443]|uniref:sensor histidine kinase n=1 Tax=Aurantimonas sp. Leaf443 TaxID=1736378 RepID=UPI001FCD55D9|nr:HAMP domain-containing sensor histidine kinase [Aurantimonas sp. Leaf443]